MMLIWMTIGGLTPNEPVSKILCESTNIAHFISSVTPAVSHACSCVQVNSMLASSCFLARHRHSMLWSQCVCTVMSIVLNSSTVVVLLLMQHLAAGMLTGRPV